MPPPRPAAPRNDVYFGMLALTAATMLVGIGVLVAEAVEYDWVTKPPATPAASLQPVPPLGAVPAGSGAPPPAPPAKSPTRPGGL